MLELEAVEPAPLVVAGELRDARLGQGHEPVAVARPDRVASRRCASSCSAANSRIVLEQPEARLAVRPRSTRTRLWSTSAIRPSRTSPPSSPAGPQIGLRRVEVAAAGEDRQPIEQPAAARRRAGRSSRRSPRAASAGARAGRATGRQDVELVLEPGEDRVGREELDPGRGELDGERHAVQPGAIAGDRRRVLVGDREARPDGDRPLDEQPDGRVLAERDGVEPRRLPPAAFSRSRPLSWPGRRRRGQARDRVLLLAARRGAAARLVTMTLSSGARPEQVGDDRGRRRRPARSCRGRAGSARSPASRRARLGDRADRRPRRRRAARAIAARRASGRGSARAARRRRRRGSRRRRVGRELERQPGLAGPARPGQRQQAGRRRAAPRLLELGVATDERRQLGRQVVRPASSVRSGGKSDRQAVADDLAQPLGRGGP